MSKFIKETVARKSYLQYQFIATFGSDSKRNVKNIFLPRYNLKILSINWSAKRGTYAFVSWPRGIDGAGE